MIWLYLSIPFNAFNFMTPILLTTVGEIITEKSGIVNIGLEGVLNLSAFVAAVTSFTTGNPLLGLITGTAIGALLGLIHGVASTYLKGDQIVIGISINIISYAISVLGLVALWRQHGASPRVPSLPTVFLAEGYSLSPLAAISVAIAISVWWFLTRTGLGLKIRACGEDPRAAEAMGVKVYSIRVLSTVLGSTLTGLAGAHLVLGIVTQFVRGIAAGRGFIALANVAFSGWNPLIAVVGAYIFGFLEALSYHAQTLLQGSAALALAYPLRTLPYVGTLVAISIFRWRAKAPRALGKPYIKE